MEQTENSKKKIFINIFIFIVIGIISLYLYARYSEHSMLEVKEYRIVDKEIPLNFSGIKIVHLSDIYFGNTTDIEEIDKIVERINAIKPDIIIFTGNLYGNNIKREEKLQSSLSKLESKLGSYAVKGNNDYYENYDSFMESIGFKVLNNEYEIIYNEDITPIFLCGLNSSLKEEINLDNCNSYFQENEELTNLYKIYAVHEGDAAKKIIESEKVNLILAGNSLGGLIRIPKYKGLIIPNGSKRYNEEYYKINNTSIYISNGIGTNDKPYRFLNKPSFNLYRLKSLK